MVALTESSIRLRHSLDGASWSPLDVIPNVPAAPTNFRATNMGTTWNSIDLAWDAAPTAVSYNVYGTWTGQTTPSLLVTTPGLVATISSMGADQNHSFYVESVNSIGAVSGSMAGPVNVHTGHPEVRKTGYQGWEGRPAATATWRDPDGWGYNADDLVQGYYTDPAYTGYGIASYDGAGFQNWVASQWGWDVVPQLQWHVFNLWVYRNASSGNGSHAVSQTYYVSSAWAGSGGRPTGAGGSPMGGHPYGHAAWTGGIPPHWAGHVLRNENVGGTGVCYSIMIHRHNSIDYSKYEGMHSHGSAFNMYVEYSWDFVSAGQVNTAPW